MVSSLRTNRLASPISISGQLGRFDFEVVSELDDIDDGDFAYALLDRVHVSPICVGVETSPIMKVQRNVVGAVKLPEGPKIDAFRLGKHYGPNL